MEQFDSSVEESSKVSEQQQRNDEQQCPSCVAELTQVSVWMIAASETEIFIITFTIYHFFFPLQANNLLFAINPYHRSQSLSPIGPISLIL